MVPYDENPDGHRHVERIVGAEQTPDGYWRVEEYERNPGGRRWFRVLHGRTVVYDHATDDTVRRVLGLQYAHLQPAPLNP